jgi:hypothetical protein
MIQMLKLLKIQNRHKVVKFIFQSNYRKYPLPLIEYFIWAYTFISIFNTVHLPKVEAPSYTKGLVTGPLTGKHIRVTVYFFEFEFWDSIDTYGTKETLYKCVIDFSLKYEDPIIGARKFVEKARKELVKQKRGRGP